MISVVIPVLDEVETVEAVIAFAHREPLVSEVIVVDDGSIDGTPEKALAAGAMVITSTMLGKGASMRDGLVASSNDIIVYLDGDLVGLNEDLLTLLTGPIIRDEADFVKAGFSRSAGRVTTLTARPLIQTFFPELRDFEQPLGGIISARRSVLESLRFENDYGVDVGLLIDVAQAGARITQVSVGHIEHDSQPLETLGDMATQVLRVILDRAARYGRLQESQIQEVREIERITQAEMPVILKKVGQAEQLALFDMDGVVLDGRFVRTLAERTGRLDALAQYIDHPTLSDEDRTRAIARIFTGIEKKVFETLAHEIPLIQGIRKTIIGLRKRGYRVGIVTDSFFIASEIVRRRVFADFSVAHIMKFRDDKATGEVMISRTMKHPNGCLKHPVCKLNAMLHLTSSMDLDRRRVLAVGDNINDICMLENSGLSFGFQPKHKFVRTAAGVVIEDDIRKVLDVVDEVHQRAAK